MNYFIVLIVMYLLPFTFLHYYSKFVSTYDIIWKSEEMKWLPIGNLIYSTIIIFEYSCSFLIKRLR